MNAVRNMDLQQAIKASLNRRNQITSRQNRSDVYGIIKCKDTNVNLATSHCSLIHDIGSIKVKNEMVGLVSF